MKPHRGRAQSAATLVATTVMGVALTLSRLPRRMRRRPRPPPTARNRRVDRRQAVEAGAAQLDARIASNPRDVQAQFKRGTVLARLNRDNDAIQQFVAITQAYPELPEPYNNLAALYAKHGVTTRRAPRSSRRRNRTPATRSPTRTSAILPAPRGRVVQARAVARSTSGATAQRLADLQKIVSPPKPRRMPAQPRHARLLRPRSREREHHHVPMSPTFQFSGPSGALAALYVAPSHKRRGLLSPNLRIAMKRLLLRLAAPPFATATAPAFAQSATAHPSCS